MKTDLLFGHFTEALRERTDEDFDCHDWTPADWFTAMVGEVGELGNMLKKVRRGYMNLFKPEDREKIGKEFGDIVAYLFIHADKLGFNLAEEAINKFNEVSERRGSDIRITGTESWTGRK